MTKPAARLKMSDPTAPRLRVRLQSVPRQRAALPPTNSVSVCLFGRLDLDQRSGSSFLQEGHIGHSSSLASVNVTLAAIVFNGQPFQAPYSTSDRGAITNCGQAWNRRRTPSTERR